MPKLKPDFRYDIQAAVYNAVDNIVRSTYVYQTCLSCKNFNEGQDICKLANQRPPARVIVNSCPQWEDDEIPF